MENQHQLDLKGKTAIVTGASKGIGRAIAESLAKNGANVIVSSRKQESVDEVAENIVNTGGKAIGIAAHVGNSEDIQNLVKQTLEKFNSIDIIVNNAAINPTYGPIQDSTEDIFEKVMKVNVYGPLELAKLAYPSMKEKGGGSIINIASIEGKTPSTGLGLYSVSKAAMISMTKVLAREWGRDNIRANVILPGLVQTKFSQALINDEKTLKGVMYKQALNKLAEPDDISGLALFLASDASSFCTGSEFVADGGFTI
ncbi:glucose 1-dehydrogenase [Mangrovivirga sp. M17]|uniref:Glucose 1-dehydrogenase n=1 Tax=Mangrovivirga halotolerans TaxID=2993936 RepID=A0ABT3RNH3_9BACT|nr:glucose 1-dehydrogenase [Mangrovivirga halotolerans]MCX2743073.1 glucose 1-dehydrogenase [Mangrovivirga halotolerans]